MIIVFTGPMKSGKTRELLKVYQNVMQTDKNVLLFKPLIDDRFSNNKIVSRDGLQANCYNVVTVEDIINKIDLKITKNIFIDEFQFITGNVKKLKYISDQNINIYVSGLDRSSELKKFKSMKLILDLADIKVFLTGICEVCKERKSIYTFYKGQKNQDILVGETNYLSVCKRCYMHLMNHKKEIL